MDTRTSQILHEAAGSVLTRSGIRIDSQRALTLLAEHGVRIDAVAHRAYPTLDHVNQALASVPARFDLYDRKAEQPLAVEAGCVQVISGGASVRVLNLEGRFEGATWDHLRQFTTLMDALPHVHILLNQVDPPAGATGYYRKIAAELMLGCRKPFLLQAGDAGDVRAFADMAAVLRGSAQAAAERPLFMTGANAEPPLCIPESAAEILLTAAAAGIPCGIGDYLMMGITGPVTVAGALVQRHAMQLTALLLSQFTRPGAPFYYVGASGAANLQTLDPRMANPLAVRILRASVELGRACNLPVCGLSPTDARQPDGQAACERAVTFQAALAAGAQLIQGPTSMMDQMMLSSFAQAVIDDDIVGYLLAAHEPLVVTDDELALDAIDAAATDSDLGEFKFAAHPHTLAHLRDKAWQPLVFDCDTFAGWQKAGSPALVERATAVARDILARHRPEPVASDQAAAIKRIADA